MAISDFKEAIGAAGFLVFSIGASFALATAEASSQDPLDCDKAGSPECRDGTSDPGDDYEPEVWNGVSPELCARRDTSVPIIHAATGAYEGRQCIRSSMVPACNAETTPAKNLFGNKLSEIQCVPEWIVTKALSDAGQPSSPVTEVPFLCANGNEPRQVVIIDRRTSQPRTEWSCRGTQDQPVVASGPSEEPPRQRPRRPEADEVRDNRTNEFGLTKEGKQNLDRCVHAILFGPQAKKVRVGEYDFNCKPPDRWTQIGNIWEFEARLSHHRPRGAADDQVDYRFTIARDGTIEGFDVNIYESATFRKYVNPIAYEVWRNKLKFWEPQDIANLMAPNFEGKWEDMSGLIMATAISRLSSSFSIARDGVPARSQDMFYYVDLRGSDIRKIDLSDRHATPAMCARQCNLENGCRSWTFHKPNKNSKKAMCWLKDAVPKPSIRYGTVSGLRPRRN